MLERIGPKESSYQICICVVPVNKIYMPMHSNQTHYKLSVPHGEMELVSDCTHPCLLGYRTREIFCGGNFGTIRQLFSAPKFSRVR